ncbi:MAG TPA: 2-phosphosulfolactate phosphatase [Chloroflexota bacterium]|nr:2-phosphosulfolactate phosphatase [Chloroflexota bacterium]
MAKPLTLDVAFLPGEVVSLEGRVAVVLDVLRASSTIVTLFDRGAESIGLAISVEAARSEARQVLGPRVLCGEVGGLTPYGFDYGNSPGEFAELDFSGKHVVMATTNGTAAVRACASASAILIGCLLNANAVIRESLDLLRQLEGLLLVCAGRQGQFVLDDAIAAGYLCHIFLNETKVRDLPVSQSNSAIAAYRLYHSYPNLISALNESASAQALYPLRLGGDVSYCAQTSITKRAPRLGTTDREGLYLL